MCGCCTSLALAPPKDVPSNHALLNGSSPTASPRDPATAKAQVGLGNPGHRINARLCEWVIQLVSVCVGEWVKEPVVQVRDPKASSYRHSPWG